MGDTPLANRIDALPSDAQTQVAELVERLAKKAEETVDDALTADEMSKHYESLTDVDRLRVSRMVRKAAGRRAPVELPATALPPR